MNWKIVLVVLVLCLCLIGIASADIIANNKMTFQDLDDINYVFPAGPSIVEGNHPEINVLNINPTIHTFVSGDDPKNYFAFTNVNTNCDWTTAYDSGRIMFYDIVGENYYHVGTLGEGAHFTTNIINAYDNNNRWELLISETHSVTLYIDGVYTWGNCFLTGYPETFGIAFGEGYTRIDDISFGLAYRSIMSSVPKGSKVLIDPQGINANALVDSSGNQITTGTMYVSYGFSLNQLGTTVEVSGLGGEIIHTENITTSGKYAGDVPINLSLLDKTGIYIWL